MDSTDDIDFLNEQASYRDFCYHFGGITEPRQENKCAHLLSEVLFISVLAVICGADGFVTIEKYAKSKVRWLKGFLKLPNGIPSHDTFGRVLSLIDPVEFEGCFLSWVREHYSQYFSLADQKDILNVDGKTLCNSADKSNEGKAIHMVSVLSVEFGLVLGQIKCAQKSNEITAIPKLLKILDLEGKTVTIDAMGTQKEIAKVIIKGKGDYVLALKGNQGNLHKEVVELFEKIEDGSFSRYQHEQHEQWDKGHGRIEHRQCTTVSNLEWLYEVHKWKGIKSVARVVSNVQKNGTSYSETRYYISSLDGNAKEINQAVRKHWHIENKLHWILDVAFKEDHSMIRKGSAPENISIIRRIALNKLKQDKSVKEGIQTKRLMAAWDDSYALKILGEMIVKLDPQK